MLCVFYKSMPLRCAIFSAICAVDFAAMFKDMSTTAGDSFWTYGIPWLSNTSWQTIKQSVSMFLQGPLSTSTLTYQTATPFSSCMERRSPYFACFLFGVFPVSARAWIMFPQSKHLQTSVHPMPPATHGHFDLRRPSWHDLWLNLHVGLRLLFSFVQLRKGCIFAIVTSTQAGTGVLQFVARAFNIRKFLKRTYLSCFYRKCILFRLFIAVIFTWNFWNKETMPKLL